ncbi:MAG: hypothetical protein EOM03_18305 [Clostridia bacterium]|nr:hypothetical protein [Clostridia bacterium]
MSDEMERSGENRDLPVDLIQTFLDNQAKELEIRVQELELAKQEEMHNYDVTKLSIRAQLDDMERNRTHRRQMWSIGAKLGSFFALLFAGIVALAFWLDKEQFILEVLRVAFYGGFGAAAGAYYQKAKTVGRKDESEE